MTEQSLYLSLIHIFLKKLFVACFFGMSFSSPVFAEDYGMHNYESSQQKQAQTKKSIMVNPIMIDGTGMCGGCRVNIGGETKFACVDGPDFDGFKVDFDECMQRQGMFREEHKNK